MAKTLTWLGFGVILAAVAWRLPATAQTGIPGDATRFGNPAGGLVTHFDVRGNMTALTVIDPAARVVSVYHIIGDSGAIRLRSVRNIRWDLAIDNLNGDDPLPAEVRKMVERPQ